MEIANFVSITSRVTTQYDSVSTRCLNLPVTISSSVPDLLHLDLAQPAYPSSGQLAERGRARLGQIGTPKWFAGK